MLSDWRPLLFQSQNCSVVRTSWSAVLEFISLPVSVLDVLGESGQGEEMSNALPSFNNSCWDATEQSCWSSVVWVGPLSGQQWETGCTRQLPDVNESVWNQVLLNNDKKHTCLIEEKEKKSSITHVLFRSAGIRGRLVTWAYPTDATLIYQITTLTMSREVSKLCQRRLDSPRLTRLCGQQ